MIVFISTNNIHKITQPELTGKNVILNYNRYKPCIPIQYVPLPVLLITSPIGDQSVWMCVVYLILISSQWKKAAVTLSTAGGEILSAPPLMSFEKKYSAFLQLKYCILQPNQLKVILKCISYWIRTETCNGNVKRVLRRQYENWRKSICLIHTGIATTLRGINSRCCFIVKCQDFIRIKSSIVNSILKCPSVQTYKNKKFLNDFY
jgi:hypothetical protein